MPRRPTARIARPHLQAPALRVAALAAMLALGGCASPEAPQLMNLRSGSGSPDEFSVLPNRSLEIPADLAALPEPGGRNRAAPDAREAAVEALGGDPQGGLRDPALLALARGADPEIRARLAAEDAAFRSRFSPRPLERAFGTNVYFRAYEPMSLNPQAEVARWRAAGVRVPAAPPTN